MRDREIQAGFAVEGCWLCVFLIGCIKDGAVEPLGFRKKTGRHKRLFQRRNFREDRRIDREIAVRALAVHIRIQQHGGMNRNLSDHQFDRCLELLYQGMVAIRSAARSGDCTACEEISDALHNLPDLLRRCDALEWTTEGFIEMFLEPLVAKMPAHAGWSELLTQPESHEDS